MSPFDWMQYLEQKDVSAPTMAKKFTAAQSFGCVDIPNSQVRKVT